MSALPRLICHTARRGFSTTPRSMWFFKGKEALLPDPLEHATGLEKRQLMAKLQGNDDPFDMSVSPRIEKSTKENPNIVYSAFDERLMGCICEEDASHVKWMWVRKGEVKRCACGHFFKLDKMKAI